MARTLGDDVLFPQALLRWTPRTSCPSNGSTASRKPASTVSPARRALDGMGLPDMGTGLEIIEILAGGCLTTTFVWIQHHGAVRALIDAGPSRSRRVPRADVPRHGARRRGVLRAPASRPTDARGRPRSRWVAVRRSRAMGHGLGAHRRDPCGSPSRRTVTSCGRSSTRGPALAGRGATASDGGQRERHRDAHVPRPLRA